MTVLIVKHFVADFPLQTMTMVLNKGTYGDIRGIDHSAVHGMLTMFVVFPFLPWNELTLHWAVVLGLLDAAVHYHVDWAKMQINRRYNLTPQDNRFWILLGLDQLAHYLTYVLICAIMVSLWQTPQ